MRGLNEKTAKASFLSFFVSSVSVIAVGLKAHSKSEVGVQNLSWSSDIGEPVQLLDGKSVEARSDTQFLKMRLHFDKAHPVERVAIESCAGDFRDGVDFHFYPGWRVNFIEGGKSVIEAKTDAVERSTTAISIVFRHNDAVCLKSLRVFLANEKTAADLRAMESDSSPRPQANSATATGSDEVRRSFSTSGLMRALDRELSTREDKENWVFRFRGDGTFFIRGHDDDFKAATTFSAMGTYLLEKTEPGRLRLILTGIRYVTPHLWDGEVCWGPCSQSQRHSGERRVSEVIEIERRSPSVYMIRNRVDKAARTLPFSDLRTRVSTLDE